MKYKYSSISIHPPVEIVINQRTMVRPREKVKIMYEKEREEKGGPFE